MSNNDLYCKTCKSQHHPMDCQMTETIKKHLELKDLNKGEGVKQMTKNSEDKRYPECELAELHAKDCACVVTSRQFLGAIRAKDKEINNLKIKLRIENLRSKDRYHLKRRNK